MSEPIDITLFVVLILLLIMEIIIYINKKKNVDNIKISAANSKMYKQELDRMILYETVYHIEVVFGNTFRDKKGISGDDVDNSDILKAVEEIGKVVIKNMSNHMKIYLYRTFGREWIFNYINIQAMSLTLNYTRLNMNSLTLGMFK